MKFFPFWFVLFAGLLSCTHSPQSNASDSYIQSLQQWHVQRIKNLTRSDGWLTLVGLQWLKEGKNKFGSDPSNDIRFPRKIAPPFMGQMIRMHDKVSVVIQSGIPILVEGKTFKGGLLKTDADLNPTIMRYKSLLWYIIKRGDKLGVRIKDTLASARLNFKGIQRFPADTTFRVKARFVKADSFKTIPIPTAIGTIDEEPSPGTLFFSIKGKEFSLDPIGSIKDSSWFIVFGDQTNGQSTYGAGRFLSIQAPDSSGFTTIDFNKAYNPPCVFTPYATCPLPPPQNNLALEIRAGEKITGLDHPHD